MTVSADSIVKTLNVIKHIRLGVLRGGVDVAFDSLFLQAAKEGLGNCVDAPMSRKRCGGFQIDQDEWIQLANDVAL